MGRGGTKGRGATGVAGSDGKGVGHVPHWARVAERAEECGVQLGVRKAMQRILKDGIRDEQEWAVGELRSVPQTEEELETGTGELERGLGEGLLGGAFWRRGGESIGEGLYDYFSLHTLGGTGGCKEGEIRPVFQKTFDLVGRG